MSQFRVDIQALRGIAVALVVLDHFGIGPFKHGFLGVDVFFVISGFLITSIIAGQIADGTFSFREFYFRRAKRLLPAAYAVVLATSVASAWLLNALEMEGLNWQVLGALTFTSNIVLWKQTGYFDVAAAYKPLLHMWSLAVEEQFYLLFPALLFFVPRRRWLPLVAVLAVVSFIACLKVGKVNASAAFYMLPTRGWELMTGALGALLAHRISGSRPLRALFWPAVVALLVIPIRPTGRPHPGVDALIVCAATIVIILARNTWASRSFVTRALAKLGDASYSLYLVHWPLVVFMNSAFVDAINLPTRLVVLALSVLLSLALYFGVEEPFRRARVLPFRIVPSAVAAALALVLVQFVSSSYAKAGIDFAYVKRPNYGLDRVCDSHEFQDRAECRTAAAPATLVWGDSYAMHVVPGIVGHTKGGIVQATYSACPPFLGTAPYVPGVADTDRAAKLCIEFNQAVLRYVEQSPTIRTVVLAGSFWQYTIDSNHMLSKRGDDYAVNSTSLATVEADLGRTIAAVKKAGKQVVVISPPPSVGDDNVTCMERRATGKFVLGNNPRCELDAARYRDGNSGVLQLADQVEREHRVRVVRLADVLCDKDSCKTLLDGVPIYRDSGHLSYAGSEKVFDLLARSGALW